MLTHLNQTGLAIYVQVFDWSTTVRKVVLSLKTQCPNQNSARNDRRRPWRTLRDNDATDVQKLLWRRDPA